VIEQSIGTEHGRDSETPFHLTAYGLAIESEWPLPGARRAGGAAEPTRVRALPTDAIDAIFAEPSERVYAEEPRIDIRRSETHFTLSYDVYGRFCVTVDGTEAACEAGGSRREYQERLLFSQVLPIAAVMRGYELLHGSAVVIAGGVVVFLGPSGAGKTTLASGLIRRGATLVTDDVLALEPTQTEMLAHPGASMMVVLPEDLDPSSEPLGPVLGRSDKIHFGVDTPPGPLPLRAIYYLEPSETFSVARVKQPDVPRLLGAVFLPYLTGPDRLRRHLDTAHLLNERVDQFRLRIPRTATPEAIVDSVHARLQEDLR
jgi:hypothetical protein